MKKKSLICLFGWLLMVYLVACAPSTDKVARECRNEQDQSVNIGGVEYQCPLPTPTADNIPNAISKNLELLCKENGEVWQDPTNSEWLGQNVVGPAEFWKYEEGLWVYTYQSEHVSGAFGGFELQYKESFDYPGFGTFKVYSKSGEVRIVNNQNQPTWGFVKLELSCN